MSNSKKLHRVDFIKKLILFLNDKNKFLFLANDKKFIYEENKDIDIIIRYKNFTNLKKNYIYFLR